MKKLLVLLIFLISSNSFAGDVWYSSTIKSVYPLSDGAFILRLDTDSASCQSGESPKYYYVKVGENGMTQEALNILYSTALAAGMSGKSVSINFDDSSTSCYINRMMLDF